MTLLQPRQLVQAQGPKMRSIAFDEAKQDRYKAALARAAGTPVSNVDIKSIKEGLLEL